MSKKTEKTYVVRGFNHIDEAGYEKPTGVIDDKTTFKEVVVKTQADAIVTMLTDDQIGTMSTVGILNNSDGVIIGEYDKNVRDPNLMISIVDLQVTLNIVDKLEVKNVKSDLREILKHWAEKSRVKNRRGFRSSAIRTPVFEYGKWSTGSTIVKVQVILSNATIYSDSKADVTPLTKDQVLADLGLLRKELIKCLDSKYGGLSYTHSMIGKGKVLPCLAPIALA